VTQGGANVVDAPVYLFTAAGSYLGKYERTDATGIAEFLLPDQQYKFRVDYEGTQYWSDVVTIIPHEENNMELNLDLLTLDLTNDPNPVRFDGTPPTVEPKKVMVASLIDLTGLLVQGVVAQIPGETIYYYVNDHLGTPQRMIDDNGTVVWSADYEPFGQANITVNTIPNNFRFPPRTGRYIEPDPSLTLNVGIPFLLEAQLDDSRALHLYSYAANNPGINIDPLGLEVAGYGGWEGQFVFGYGHIYIMCCDGCNLLKHKYKKFCFGAAFIGGISTGGAFKAQGKNCSSPPRRLIGPELGFGLGKSPLGVEGGAAFDIERGGGTPYVGGSGGMGFKATVCYYWLSESTKIGSCSR
jgi:hypothetical protein